MRFTETDIQKLARLSKLYLSPEEVSALANDLSKILDYVAHLNSVPPAPASKNISKNSHLRSDSAFPVDSATLKLLRQNFPLSERGFLKFKKTHQHE